MNAFRFIADMLHLLAIMILLYRIKKARNCIGNITFRLLYILLNLSYPKANYLFYRSVMQDLRIISTRVLYQIR